MQYLIENLGGVSDPYKRFISRIANQESFNCVELEINPESKAFDVQVALLVQHLSAIITTKYKDKSRNQIVCCLVDPLRLKQSYVLAAPENELGYNLFKHTEATKTTKYSVLLL